MKIILDGKETFLTLQGTRNGWTVWHTPGNARAITLPPMFHTYPGEFVTGGHRIKVLK